MLGVVLRAARATRAASTKFPALDTFVRRHIGPGEKDVAEMLKVVGASSLTQLGDMIVPASIRKDTLSARAGKGEFELLQELKGIADQNKIARSLLGMGYADTITPTVILRNVVENPAWYTPYTPYQAEIAQGRLESLVNFQTMVTDLTGMDISNASLLDESTAAAEAMSMCFDNHEGTFFIDSNVHPQTIAVCKTRAEFLGIPIKVGNWQEVKGEEALCGVLVQYPNTLGAIEDYRALSAKVHQAQGLVVAATDLLALTKLTPPGEWGADVCVGTSQRFGVPLGYGGPHAAFLATRDQYKRKMPGRIIGISKDSRGERCYRIALQTREQHIRREKATSNICTAQALLANVSAMYAVYHGPAGLTEIATRVHDLAATFASGVKNAGFGVPAAASFFDTVTVDSTSPQKQEAVLAALAANNINVRVLSPTRVCVAFDEKSTGAEVDTLFKCFGVAGGSDSFASVNTAYPAGVGRTSAFLTHAVFNTFHSETEMLRYIFYLASKDYGLQQGMIPLGSCTMKLNATTEMIPITWPGFNNLHPFAPISQAQGYQYLFKDLSEKLAEATGFHSVSLQPNSGAQGEYTGLAVIKKYLASIGQGHRNLCLIPASAHGTNPASAAVLGMQIVVVKSQSNGNIDFEDLVAKCETHKDNLAAIMITYPSTHGVFEDNVKDVVDTVHKYGGQVYMDGANLNAQLGLTSPGDIGADVCHLNLHKTFCIPHGGGGPGMGPIGVASHLAPFLPSHPVVASNTNPSAMLPVSAAPWGSASILPISWVYLHLMGSRGLVTATQMALLNANYMRKRLEGHYKVLFSGANGMCAHEFILDMRPITDATGIGAEDVAKRLQDYGFHAPTMSFPVPNTLMIEPTESEPKSELDRMVDALISIRHEISLIEQGKMDKVNNPLKNAPHTQDMVISSKWDKPYSVETAAFPTPRSRKYKVWPTVGRIDNAYGDRNLTCACPPLEVYF
eukprot:TRINITY_DN737_c0_g1_i1.p1 TRINITY_DN737_c0_g1~~TRINITY_DN737_c0_g1_i1.p1  ORF type:complete len:973 (-),score=231.68 TRINITY_DN737_c0_g1_i1:120-3011(-)